MPYVNLPDTLQTIIGKINDRLTRLEMSKRFTAPSVATDPSNPRPGDIWLNTTSNTLKAVDKNGAIKTITWV